MTRAASNLRAGLPWLPWLSLALVFLPGLLLGQRLLWVHQTDPVAATLNGLGYWAMVFLWLSLAASPLKDLLGWGWPLRLRRQWGLASFGYAFSHLAFYLVVDQGLHGPSILDDVLKRRFITVGFLAFLLLVPLAVTSTHKMVRRLGFGRWKGLHRVVYPAALLVLVHFIWRHKVVSGEHWVFGALLGFLLLARPLGRWVRGLRRSRGKPGAPR